MVKMTPENRTETDFIINLVGKGDTRTPHTFMSIGAPEGVPLVGTIHAERFDLDSGQAKLSLVDIRLADVGLGAVCTIDGSIETFRSADPLARVP